MRKFVNWVSIILTRQGLYISGNKELSDDHMGKYPVIFLSLKGVEGLELDAACEAAMAQIKNKRYDEALRYEDRCDILAYGIAFCRKRCRVAGEKL